MIRSQTTLSPTGRRGVTIVELMVTIAVASIIAVPVAFVIVQVAKAEQQMTSRLAAARESDPLAVAFRGFVQKSAGDPRASRSGDDIVWPNAKPVMIGVDRQSITFLRPILGLTWEPTDATTPAAVLRPFARLQYDATARTVTAIEFVDNLQGGTWVGLAADWNRDLSTAAGVKSQYVVARNIDAIQFRYGPTNVVATGGTMAEKFGDMKMDENDQLISMDLTANVNGETVTYRILSYSPNIKLLDPGLGGSGS